jgi:hypothetical protein
MRAVLAHIYAIAFGAAATPIGRATKRPLLVHDASCDQIQISRQVPEVRNEFGACEDGERR